VIRFWYYCSIFRAPRAVEHPHWCSERCTAFTIRFPSDGSREINGFSDLIIALNSPAADCQPGTCQVGRLVCQPGGPPRQMLKEEVGWRSGPWGLSCVGRGSILDKLFAGALKFLVTPLLSLQGRSVSLARADLNIQSAPEIVYTVLKCC